MQLCGLNSTPVCIRQSSNVTKQWLIVDKVSASMNGYVNARDSQTIASHQMAINNVTTSAPLSCSYFARAKESSKIHCVANEFSFYLQSVMFVDRLNYCSSSKLECFPLMIEWRWLKMFRASKSMISLPRSDKMY
ncbi:hypothetical protein NP493_1423g01039 [Ridgeia piscesae]|uniref:Uncharacterized protein n=1 Tax=Ridgeia piscesae TaxID=27915 RepID=A0AAD9NBK7_RIDPI|nr:hypothetical protein NP493_1423g01039 [Ridgeia piscesae]